MILGIYFVLSFILTALSLYGVMVLPLETIESLDDPKYDELAVFLETYRMEMEVSLLPSFLLLAILLLFSPFILLAAIIAGRVKVTHE
jgi:hypothetical protein